MEKPARVRTTTDPKEIVLHWAKELRKAEKNAMYPPAGKRAEAESRLRDVKKKFNEAVDVLLGKIP